MLNRYVTLAAACLAAPVWAAPTVAAQPAPANPGVQPVADAAPVEACLTPARDGLRLAPLPAIGADHG